MKPSESVRSFGVSWAPVVELVAPVRACTSALLLLLLLAWADRLLVQAAQVPSMHTTAKRSRER
jgi:hypothetical protein